MCKLKSHLLNNGILWLFCETQVRLDSTETREQFLCLLIIDRVVNNDIVAWLQLVKFSLIDTFQSIGVTRE